MTDPQAPRRDAALWRLLRQQRGALTGAAVFLLIVALVCLGPLLWPQDPLRLPRGRDLLDLRDKRPIYTALWAPAAKVSWAHPLGTDNLGRDTLARLLLGGRVSVAVGLTAMAISVALGTLVGLLAGFYRRLDGLLMRLTDLFLALPLLPLLLVASLLFRAPLTARLGAEGGMFALVVTLIGLTSWMQCARVVRGDVLALRQRDFLLAARASGTRDSRLISRHLLPNILSPVLVSATLGIASAILAESALSFLGFGFPPDFPTWGQLLNDGVARLSTYPERAMWPGVMISLTVLSVNAFGEGLRDALDPRFRRP